MRLTSLVLLATIANVAQAQQQSPAVATGGASTGNRVPIRPLGDIVATSAESLGTVAGVRALPNGGVLVNDIARRRVVMLDGRLGAATTVVDSSAGAVNSYGTQPGGLLAYRGDSSLFVDPASLSMLVVDPRGAVVRVMSVPRSDDARALTGVGGTSAGFDAQGRLVYRGMPRITFDRRSGPMAGGGAPGAGGAVRSGGAPGAAPNGAMPTMPMIPQAPDTMPIVRVDLATRKVDTLSWIHVQRPNVSMTTGDDGQMQMRITMNPLPTIDEWTVTSDGAVAIVRGHDYRVDWVGTNGAAMTGTKLPFDWKRMSDDDKEAFIDSLKAVRARQGPNAPMPMVGGAPTAAPSQIVTRMEMSGGPGGAPPRSETRVATAPNFEFVPASELPDYRPAFFPGAVRADRDGNVWIRTTSAPTVAGASVWDVVDRKGTLVDRVQVPTGATIIGFASDGTAILATREGTSTKLQKAKLR